MNGAAIVARNVNKTISAGSCVEVNSVIAASSAFGA